MLANLNIMITRPGQAGAELCALIEAEQGKAIHFPTIQFAPPEDSQSFKQAVKTLPAQDYLIFVSPQAVLASAAEIDAATLSHVQIAAIGAGTAKALQDAGFKQVTYPKETWNSEGLLALPEFIAMQSKKVAIIRGAGGREQLAKTLAERGALITHVIAYQRVVPEWKIEVPAGVYPGMFLAGARMTSLNAIVCTSFEAVQNLTQIFARLKCDDIQKIPLIVVSERIKILAQDLGFQTIWVARNASHQAILDSIRSIRRIELCQRKS